MEINLKERTLWLQLPLIKENQTFVTLSIFLLINFFFFFFLPNAKGNLQQSADTRDEEDGTDEVALCEAVMLQAQSLRQD